MQHRSVALLTTLFLLTTGCPGYDRYDRVVDQDGLVPADQFAAYGTEQAQAVAIGRAFGSAYTGDALAARARQIDAAVTFARQQRDVAGVVADTTASLLTVTFSSGWRKAIIQIHDGVPAEMTVGLPPGNR